MKYTLVFDSDSVWYFLVGLLITFVLSCLTASLASTIDDRSPYWFDVVSIITVISFVISSAGFTFVSFWNSFSFEKVKRGSRK